MEECIMEKTFEIFNKLPKTNTNKTVSDAEKLKQNSSQNSNNQNEKKE